MTWTNPTEAARRLGISAQALRKKLPALEEEGQARRDGKRWKIRLEGLEVVYDDVTRSRSDSPRKVVADQRQQRGGSVEGERSDALAVLDAVRSDPNLSRGEAERLIAVSKAKLLALDVEEREGSLVEVEAVERRLFESGRRVRDLLLGIPVRIAADLASSDDPVQISIILQGAINETLGELANGLEQSGDR